MIDAKKHYINTNTLEEWWSGWIVTGCPHAWEQLSNMIYQICEGIAKRFNPPTPEEHQEHVHDAFLLTLEKISDGRLTFIPKHEGGRPVFNLLTTTIFRHLYSKMNKAKRHQTHMKNYSRKIIQEKNPELLKNLRDEVMMA